MNQLKAQGFLIAAAINQLLEPSGQDEEDYSGCCIINCAPCAALHWLWKKNSMWADSAVREAFPDAGWSWQLSDGGINWTHLEADWATHKGCVSTAGVWSCSTGDEPT